MNKWSLNTKIFLIVSIFVVSSSLIAFVGISRMGIIDQGVDNIVDVDVKRLSGAEELRADFLSLVLFEKNLILEDSKEEMEKIIANTEKTNTELDKMLAELMRIASAEGKKDLEQIVEAKKAWKDNLKEIQKLALSGNDKEAFKLSAGKGRELRLKVENIVDQIVERNKKRMDVASDESTAIYEKARLLMIIVSVVSILIGLGVSYYVMRNVSRAIDQVINHLTDNSGQVTSAAHQIAASSVELSQAATEQSASLEQTSASIEELSSMVQKNADNAKKTSEISEHSKDNAGRGKEVVQEMITAIHEINASNDSIKTSIDESNKKISEIVDVINEIGNKTKVINDIVFQTKLLSFNASVEAARAGEHGKGFAVVAEEVGNLAQMSGNAAKEISSMLDDSIAKVQNIVRETKEKVGVLIGEGHEKVEKGTRIAEECGKVLDDIVKNITNVNQMSEEISVASQEQAQGVNEITKAMAQLDQVTQTNAAASEQAAQAAEELSAQAESLRSMVGVLVETIKGTQSEKQKTAFDITSNKRADQSQVSSKHESKVISMKKTVASVTKPSKVNLIKKASGDMIPSHSDSRFEEV